MNTSEANVKFLTANDDMALFINEKANELFRKLKNFDVSVLSIDPVFKNYFIHHHLNNRLVFSIQNSAHIIYRSVKKAGKPINEINLVDYGAGLGTLYMLCGMLNFKRSVYNDYLPDWKNTARSICESLGINNHAYITGDIDEVVNYATTENFKFDIIASRNVIEHIYDLPYFFNAAYKHNPNAIIFSTTSANFHNPAMRLKHYFLHKKVEKNFYFNQRKEIIKKKWPTATPVQLHELTEQTRGIAKEDFIRAIEEYQSYKPVKPVKFLRTNTCDCMNGIWHEHLLTRQEYKSIIAEAGYKMEYTAGYWDTNYKSGIMNITATLLNKLIIIFGKKGYVLSPFINIIAYN